MKPIDLRDPHKFRFQFSQANKISSKINLRFPVYTQVAVIINEIKNHLYSHMDSDANSNKGIRD